MKEQSMKTLGQMVKSPAIEAAGAPEAKPMTQPDPIKTIEEILVSFFKQATLSARAADLANTPNGVEDALKSFNWCVGDATQAINTEIYKAKTKEYRKGYAAGNAARNYGGGKAIDYKKLAQEILAQLTPIQSQPEKESNDE